MQVVLAKANSFTRWDGVLVGEVNLEQAEFLSQERNLDPEFAARVKNAMFENEGLSGLS